MTFSINKTQLLGNLTRDIELRQTQGGTTLGKFGIAVNRKWYKDGEKKDSTTFVDCTVWGRQAETMAEYAAKGTRLYLEGRLEYSTWETNSGERRNKLELVVENFQFADPKPERDPNPPDDPSPEPPPSHHTDVDPDAIPF